ncbi:MAG: hypothetical protein HYZ33_00725 [Ignavibacteriales bacterium]|nr:hypothetical protein [Ignavibacteriales bacterium]
MKFALSLISLLLCSALLFVGCTRDDSPTTPGNTTTTTYSGTIAGESESGSITFVVGSTAKVTPTVDVRLFALLTVTGTIKLSDGTSITLTGTFNTETDSIYVSGGGYSFAGKLSNGTISGVYTGPNGSGAFSVQAGTQGSVKVFCGTYIENDNSQSGLLNIALKDTVLTGLSISYSDGSKTFLIGTLSGSTITMYLTNQPAQVIATGTLSGVTASGTYSSGDDQGTWTMTLCDSIPQQSGNPFVNTKWVGFEDDGDSLRLEFTATNFSSYKRRVFGESCWTTKTDGAYSVSGNQFTVPINGTPTPLTYRIMGNIFVILSFPPGQDGRNWTKVNSFSSPLNVCP